MKDAILLELAARWEADGKVPNAQDGSPKAEIPNAKAAGRRECKRECADTLRVLVQMLGEVNETGNRRQ